MIPEKPILILTRVTSDVAPIARSLQIRCAGCNELCWVAPTSFPIIESVTAICADCLPKFTGPDDTLAFGGFIPGQLEELRQDENGQN